MAFAEMHCTCEAEFQLDGDDEVVIPLVHRFVAAHTACGYMSPPPEMDEESGEKTVTLKKKKDWLDD